MFVDIQGWLSYILTPQNRILPRMSQVQLGGFLTFAVELIEKIWNIRNKVRLKQEDLRLAQLLDGILNTRQEHLMVKSDIDDELTRECQRSIGHCSQIPPNEGFLKVNMDVILSRGQANREIIVRNYKGLPVLVITCSSHSSSALAAEAKC